MLRKLRSFDENVRDSRFDFLYTHTAAGRPEVSIGMATEAAITLREVFITCGRLNRKIG